MTLSPLEQLILEAAQTIMPRRTIIQAAHHGGHQAVDATAALERLTRNKLIAFTISRSQPLYQITDVGQQHLLDSRAGSFGWLS